MIIDSRMSNPIIIKMGKNVIVEPKEKRECALIPGAMFGGEHYGFVLIIERNGKQREFVYPTQCSIVAAGIESGKLKIFEKGKQHAWNFDRLGNILHSPVNEFDEEFRSKAEIVLENSEMLMGSPLLIEPIKIVISKRPEESGIAIDEKIEYPLSPGVMLGDIHYGFILLIDTDEGQKEVVYPTQNRVDAIEQDGSGELRVFERGKYHPWVFGVKGKLKKEASYNPYSKRDLEYVNNCLTMNETNSEYCFVIQKKKR